MRIAFFELEGWEEKIIRENFPNDDLFASNERVAPDHLPERKDFDAISIFVDSRFSADMASQFPNLKFVATRSTGYDHVDVAGLAAKNIPVAYVPGYGDNTVAEFAFGLILNLTRHLYRAIDQVKTSGSFSLEGLRGSDLAGKTLGVVGTGRIGRQMIKIAKGFGMNILAHDPFPSAALAAEVRFSYVPLEDLLAKSDIVSLHCPYTKETHHLINSGNAKFIKKGAYLVNTSRGGVVETDALVAALQDGILAGVGLDVLEEEGEMKDELNLLRSGHPKEEELKTILRNHVLMKMPQVLMTPHTAFNSWEALGRILAVSISNIKSFIAGKPENVVKS